MKALEYKEYFTHIDSEQILTSLEDIHGNKFVQET
jgi:hypothetical protein